MAYKYEVEVNGKVFEVESERELTAEEIGAAAQQYAAKPEQSWGDWAKKVAVGATTGFSGPIDKQTAKQAVDLLGGEERINTAAKIAGSTAIGAAGTAVGAAVGALSGPLAPVTVPLGAAVGSYAARKANVALGFEEPGLGGDIASMAIPAAAGAAGPVVRSLARIPGGVVNRGGIAAALTNYLGGDPNLTFLIGAAAGFGPEILKVLGKSGPTAAATWIIEKVGPGVVWSTIGALRAGGQLAGEQLMKPAKTTPPRRPARTPGAPGQYDPYNPDS